MRSRGLRSGRRRADSGFTLPEVLIVTVLIGLVASVIASAFTVIVRTTPSARDRNDDSRSLLGLANFLPEDVSSTRIADIVIADQDTTCAAKPGTVVLYLSWTDADTGALFQVAYRFADEDGWRLVRDECRGGSLSTVALTSVLSDTGSPIPVTATPFLVDHDGLPATPPEQRGVSVGVTTLAGVYQQVDAVSDHFVETLTPVVVTSSSPSTTAPPANLAPEADNVEFEAWPGHTVNIYLDALDPNGDTLVADVPSPPALQLPAGWGVSFTSGPVPLMVLTIDPAAVIGTEYRFDYEVRDPFGLTDQAEVRVDIIDPINPTTTTTSTTTTTTTTTIACSVSSMTLSQSTVGNGPPALARLRDPITVTITKSGSCANLILSFTPNESGAPPYVVIELSFSGGTQITIGKNDYSWSDGPHVLRVLNGSGGPELAQQTLTVT